MKTGQVLRLTPAERLAYFVVEREAVRLRKESGALRPWTDDEVIHAYKFTCVRRMDDRVSRWLLKCWYGPNAGRPNPVGAALLARQLNNPDSLADVGYPARWDPAAVKATLDRRAAAGLKNFSAAYMITGTLGGSKAHQVVWKVVHPVMTDPPAVDGRSMESTWRALVGRPGVQSFMAGQVVADLRWFLPGSWADRHDWAPLGPGSRRGLNRLLGRPVESAVRQDEFLRELRGARDRLWNALPGAVTSRLEIMDFQSVCCEYDKYCRALLGEGRPKQRYTPHEDRRRDVSEQ